jgi:hypothetical protein
MFPILWQEQFARNLEGLRAELGFQAIKEGSCSW